MKALTSVELREVLLDAAAHLAAASSAYQTYAKRSPRFGKPETDALFSTRIADFQKSSDRVSKAAMRFAQCPSDHTFSLPSFDEAWRVRKAAGYQYGEDALDNARAGYELAREMLSPRKATAHYPLEPQS